MSDAVVEGRAVAATPAPDALVDRHGGLLRRTVLVSSLTLTSRLLGFVREALGAMLFGAHSFVFDAFLTAWRIPNLFRRLLGEGALSTSLQAAITEEDGRGGDAAGAALFRRVAWVTFWLLLAVCAGTMVLIQSIPDEIFGFQPLGEPEGAAAVRELTVRLMPFVVLVCLSALASGALNVRGKFFSSSAAPTAMNVVWIAALLVIGAIHGFSGPTEGVGVVERHMAMARALSIGVLLAGLGQLAVQLPELARSGLLQRASAGVRATTRRARDVLWSAAPLAFGAAVYQINVMVDGFMAEGLLTDGGPTALYFANRIQQFPLAIVATAATAAVFPALQALGHRRRNDELRALHDRTQLAVAFLAVPAGLGLFALSLPVARACLEYGAFDFEGSKRVAAGMAVLAFGLFPAGAVGLVSRVYYSLGDLRTPVLVSAACMVANLGLNLVFVVMLEMDVAGLCLGTTLAAWLQLLWLVPGMTRKLGLPRSAPGRARGLVRIFAASTASAAAAFVVERATFALLPASWPGGAASAFALGPGIVAAVVVYVAMARALRIDEWKVVEARIRSRFARAKSE